MPLSSPKKLTAGYEPIEGYRLEEVIGVGGFGEVWRADAPGGIKKAVKFVFGDHDGHRAEREMKSLERIKGVQHPFLLTLERFEIVDGQLVIVTELADGSLEDVFNRHRERGSCGIPREALLTYMNDAADALDYLHEMYQLQHLDIKPANLLMVGGHVKVADFGLLKDLRDADCSMIGGLTPIYAPPELFDGKPSMNSDQYSLGVMYQELLTGVRPFSGRTIAQLATQHVHNAPNLESLPSCDQPIIARALEKNPDRRYTNCRDFVAELREPNTRQTSSAAVQTTVGANSILPLVEPNDVQDLPQLDGKHSNANTSSAESGVATPVLVVALGGYGARCIAKIRSQLSASSDRPISLHAITIDTDLASTRQVGRSDPSLSVPWCESLHTPLKTAQEYRSCETDHLRTVSRRWLYNLPRSGQTEGMRPLGRLALVDHGKQVVKLIQQGIEATLRSAQDSRPLVYVVGSTSGGTSSGMYTDVIHLVRHCLDEAGLQGTNVVSLLLAPPMRNDPRRPLLLHDTKAMLAEISHLMQPGNGYPGDEGAGWPSIPAARSPLRDAYLIAASTEPGMPSPIQAACDYIFLSGSGGGETLKSARLGLGDKASTAIEASSLRSVGIVQLTEASTRNQRVIAATEARQLILDWLGNPIDGRASAVATAERLKRRAKIGLDEFSQPIIRSFAADRNARRSKLMTYLRSIPSDQLRDHSLCMDALTRHFQKTVQTRETTSLLTEVADTLQRELAARLHDGDSDVSKSIEATRALAKMLREEIIQQSDSTSNDLNSPISESTKASESSLRYSTLENAPDHEDHRDECGPDNHSSPLLLSELRCATDMGEDLLIRLANDKAITQLTALCDVLGRLEERLSDGAAKLAQCIRAIDQSGARRESPASANRSKQEQKRFEDAHGRLAAKWLVRLLSESGVAIDPVEMSKQTIAEFESILSEPQEPGKFATQSQVNISKSVCGVSTLVRGQSGTETPDTDILQHESVAMTCELTNASDDEKQLVVIHPPTVEDAIRAVRPPLLDCGGKQRVILFVGSDEDKSQYESSVRQSLQGELTVVMVPQCVPTLVHEAQQIKIEDILQRIGSLTLGQEEIARRLQSRCDIDW